MLKIVVCTKLSGLSKKRITDEKIGKSNCFSLNYLIVKNLNGKRVESLRNSLHEIDVVKYDFLICKIEAEPNEIIKNCI